MLTSYVTINDRVEQSRPMRDLHKYEPFEEPWFKFTRESAINSLWSTNNLSEEHSKYKVVLSQFLIWKKWRIIFIKARFVLRWAIHFGQIMHLFSSVVSKASFWKTWKSWNNRGAKAVNKSLVLKCWRALLAKSACLAICRVGSVPTLSRNQIDRRMHDFFSFLGMSLHPLINDDSKNTHSFSSSLYLYFILYE